MEGRRVMVSHYQHACSILRCVLLNQGWFLSGPRGCFMSKMQMAFHDLVEEISGNSTFGESVRIHIPGVTPDYMSYELGVNKFTHVLHMYK